MSLSAQIADIWREHRLARSGGVGLPPSRGGVSPLPGGPAALPCQTSNNSPTTTLADAEKQPLSGGYKLHKKARVIKGAVGTAKAITATVPDVSIYATNTGLDREGRLWTKGEEGTWEKMIGGVTSAERKRAFALRSNAEAFTNHYKRERCGFLTLTPEKGSMTPKEFGEAFDDMRKHGLKWMRSYIRVLEPQKRGAPHYHLMVAVDFDMAPDSFDWESLFAAAEARKPGDFERARTLTRKYAESAPERLREAWAELRDLCRRHGLGRSEFLPFRKGAGQLASYVGKYLEAGLAYRRDEWKGARRVEYDRKQSREWKSCASSFAWASPGAKEWRGRVGELACACGAGDCADLAKKLGPKWAYHWRESIMTLNYWEWWQCLAVVALRMDGWMPEGRLLSMPNMDQTLALMRGESAEDCCVNDNIPSPDFVTPFRILS